MRKPKQDPAAIIDCGDSSTAYLAYLAMFRYAFGRMTYMPNVVIELIMRNAATLTLRTLEQLDSELTEEAKTYERVYKDRPGKSNYGMEYDHSRWLAFHEWVKEQIRQRKTEEGADA